MNASLEEEEEEDGTPLELETPVTPTPKSKPKKRAKRRKLLQVDEADHMLVDVKVRSLNLPFMPHLEFLSA